MSDNENSGIGIPKESYIIATTTIPKKSYSLGNNYTLRAIRFRLPKSALEEVPFRLNVYGMALSKVDDRSLVVYKDLVVFHSFISNSLIHDANTIKSSDSITYGYAETSNRILVDDSALSFIPESIKGDAATDFDQFPVVTNVDEGMNPTIVSIEYSRAFWAFTKLKSTKKNKKLYNQIQLWEFARNFNHLHRIYSNDNFPPAFYVAILDSILGRPEQCTAVLECKECGRAINTHDKKDSWTSRFLNEYGNQFKEYLENRNKAFHDGAYLDFFEEWDRIGSLDEKEGAKTSEKLDKRMWAADELEGIVYDRLLKAFLDIYRSESET